MVAMIRGFGPESYRICLLAHAARCEEQGSTASSMRGGVLHMMAAQGTGRGAATVAARLICLPLKPSTPLTDLRRSHRLPPSPGLP